MLCRSDHELIEECEKSARTMAEHLTVGYWKELLIEDSANNAYWACVKSRLELEKFKKEREPRS